MRLTLEQTVGEIQTHQQLLERVVQEEQTQVVEVEVVGLNNRQQEQAALA